MPDLTRTLLYQIETIGLDKLDAIPASQQKIALETRYSSQELSKFEQVLRQTAAGGTTYTQALKDIAASNIKADETYRAIAKTLLENERAQQNATRAAERESNKRIAQAKQEEIAWRQAAQGAAQISGFGGVAFGGANLARGVGLGAAAGVIGAGVAAYEGFNLVKGAAEQARQLQNLANEFGLTAQQAFKLDAAAKLVGEDFSGSVSRAARKLAEAIEEPGGAGKKTAEELTKLGVNLRQGIGGALEETLQKLAGIEDPGKRATEALVLFGQQGAKMAEVAGELRNVGQSLDENIQRKLLEANRTLADFGNSWTIVKGQIAAALVDSGKQISSFLQQLGSLGDTEGILAGNFDQTTRGDLKKDNAAARALRKPNVPSTQIRSSRLEAALGSGKLGLDDRIAAARRDYEDEKSRANNLLGTGSLAEQNAEIAVVERLRKAYEALEAQKKNPKKDNFKEEMRAYLEASETADLGPVGLAQRERDKLIAKFGERARAGAIQGYDERLGFGPDGLLRPSRGIIGRYGEQAQRSLEAETRRNERDLQIAGWEGGRETPEAKLFSDNLRRKIEEDRRAPELLKEYSRLDLGAQTSTAQNQSTLLSTVSEAQGLSTPNNNYAAQIALARQLFSIREKEADLLADSDDKQMARTRALYEYIEAGDKARLDRAEAILRANQKSHEQTGQFTSGLVDAAISGDVGGFFRSFGRQTLSTIAGNFGKNLPFSINSALSLGKSGALGSADNPNFLGKLLEGTPLGIDRGAGGDANSQATNENTTATTANTNAVAALATLVGNAMGVSVSPAAVGGTSVSLPGLPNPGSISSGNGTFDALSALVGGPGGTSGFAGPVGLMNLADEGGDSSSVGSPGTSSIFRSSGWQNPKGGLTSATGDTVSGFAKTIGALTSGAGIGLSGHGLGAILTGAADLGNGTGVALSGLQRVGAAASLGGTEAAGILGAISGFGQGGGRGISKGLGSTFGAAAALDPEPISKTILGIGAAVSGLISSVFGDPRQERMTNMQHTISHRQFIQPASRDYSFGSGDGSTFNYGEGGGIRSGGFNTAAPMTVNVNAMDASSFVDWGRKNPQAFGQAMLYGVSNGGVGALTSELQLQVGGGWSG